MKKILALFIVLSMTLVGASVMAEQPADTPIGDCAWDDGNCIGPFPTTATMTGSASGGETGSGNTAPIIKCKWEYDLEVEVIPEDCDPCIPCTDPYWYHDACCCIPGLQVKPILYDSVSVGYYAIVTDLEGVDHIDHVYADIWHPDGTFKYQIELFPVGMDGTPASGGVYDKTQALDIWNHAWAHHSDLIKINPDWASTLVDITPEADILDELNEELAYLYYGEAEISYCQPGGWYYVGVRAHDGYDAYSDYLFNRFWYIPTAGIHVDFSGINYGTVAESTNKWVGGDYDWSTTSKPSVRNVGNTPVQLMVYQDDMGFGKTGDSWNVMFDARMNADGPIRTYYPEQKDLIEYPPEGDPNDPSNYYPGVWIDGILPLCTMEKLDFSIHVFKGYPGEVYQGILNLCAYMDMDSYIWTTPVDFQGNAPIGVPNPYAGPQDPGPYGGQ